MYNNLRACAGACCTTLLGFTYAWCRENNVSPGYTYFLAGLIGGVIPQLMLQSMDKAFFNRRRDIQNRFATKGVNVQSRMCLLDVPLLTRGGCGHCFFCTIFLCT